MERLTNERFAEIIKDKETCEFCEDCGNDEICLNCGKVNPATVSELRAFWKELSELVKAQDEGLIRFMSCAGCRYDKTGSLAEHKAHCMRCIRNRYPDDRYEPAEAEVALSCQECRESGTTAVCQDKRTGYICPNMTVPGGGGDGV